MVIWRGWGILAFIGIGIGIGLTALISAATGTDLNGASWQAVPAFLLVGAGVYLLGQHLNVTKPTRDFANARGAHYGFVAPSIENPSGPPVILPLDQQPPLNPDEVVTLRGIKNRHTLFFIPMQWCGVLLALLGIFLSFVWAN